LKFFKLFFLQPGVAVANHSQPGVAVATHSQVGGRLVGLDLPPVGGGTAQKLYKGFFEKSERNIDIL